MTAREIVCLDCGEAVPYGRLSCPACGALLASVTGAGEAPHETWGTIGSYEPPGAAVPPHPPAPSVLTAVVAPEPAVPSPDDVTSVTIAKDAAPASARPWWAIDGLDVGIDRAVALGSGLVAVGLLLPWSRVVIGSPDLSRYVGTWGLAGPGHILVLVTAVAIAALAGVPNRVPAWIRSGVAGLVLGVFVLGLLWPYVVGPLGASVGSLIDLVGSMVLIVAGVTALWRARHVPDERGV